MVRRDRYTAADIAQAEMNLMALGLALGDRNEPWRPLNPEGRTTRDFDLEGEWTWLVYKEFSRGYFLLMRKPK